MTEQDLIDFETKIATHFNEGRIRAPVHLYDGNEKPIIKLFKKVRPQDWVFCSWRSHYQCLLKGVPADLLEEEILKGHSISLCFPEYKIYSSAIVGGVLPIALGTALSIQRNGEDSIVYCFVGDMTVETGIAHECMKYATNFNLPLKFVVEDNGKSVCTDTYKVWNLYNEENNMDYLSHWEDTQVIYYKYKTKYPHAGAGVRVQF